MTFHLTIDSCQYEASEGQTVLQVARAHGIQIPTLCDHPDLTPYGGCRLCVVEVQGSRTPLAACALLAQEGLVVRTDTPALQAARRSVLEMLLSAYVDAGYPTGSGQSTTEFERWLAYYGVSAPAEWGPPAPRFKVDADPNPFVWVDMNKCILCTRCVRACAEVQGRNVWGPAERGYATQIVPGGGEDLLAARCESCGACVAYCPTGALDNKLSMGAGLPDRRVTTTCSYCGVGCQFDLHVRAERVIRVASHPGAPVNNLALCVKGRYGYDFIHHPDRLTRPRVRRYLLDGAARGAERGEWVETDWETALDLTARKLAAIKAESGGDRIGVLASAKCTNEENYLLQKLARQVLGTHNVDHCARL